MGVNLVLICGFAFKTNKQTKKFSIPGPKQTSELTWQYIIIKISIMMMMMMTEMMILIKGGCFIITAGVIEEKKSTGAF